MDQVGVGRNCYKHWPELVNPNRLKWWRPEYLIGQESYSVPGNSTNECPVSILHREPELATWVQIYEEAQKLPGIPLYGPNLSEWPILALEAFAELDRERKAEEEIRRRAGGH